MNTMNTNFSITIYNTQPRLNGVNDLNDIVDGVKTHYRGKTEWEMLQIAIQKRAIWITRTSNGSWYITGYNRNNQKTLCETYRFAEKRCKNFIDVDYLTSSKTIIIKYTVNDL